MYIFRHISYTRYSFSQCLFLSWCLSRIFSNVITCLVKCIPIKQKFHTITETQLWNYMNYMKQRMLGVIHLYWRTMVVLYSVSQNTSGQSLRSNINYNHLQRHYLKGGENQNKIMKWDKIRKTQVFFCCSTYGVWCFFVHLKLCEFPF